MNASGDDLRLLSGAWRDPTGEHKELQIPRNAILRLLCLPSLYWCINEWDAMAMDVHECRKLID
jgi:hypothetical protein